MIIYFFLDYDGTLVPIVRRPGQALLSPARRNFLKKLSVNPRFRLAIVSGRMIKDVRSKIRLRNIPYAGNQGLEIEGPGFTFRGTVPRGFRALLRTIKRRMQKELEGIDGVLIEDKEVTLSLHYRLVGARAMPRVTRTFNAIVAPFREAGRITVNRAKKVYEIRPPVPWHKGKAVEWLLAKERKKLAGECIVPVFIGDDLPDEHAFKTLKRRGITVKVGEPGVSHAEYFLDSPQDVFRFLRAVAGLFGTLTRD